MTRSGGVSQLNHKCRVETRGAKNRKGEAASDGRAWVPDPNTAANAEVEWPEGWLPLGGTARPANADGNANERVTSREVAGGSVRASGAGGQSASPVTTGGPARRVPKRTAESGPGR